MGKAEKISVSLNGELLAELHAAVASGDYNSTSEVIREALREWRKNREREAAIETVRDMLAEADAGGYIEGFPDVEDIKRRGRERLATQR